MKLLIIILSISTFINTSASGHSGRTNASGCHNDRKNGGYHCHKSTSTKAANRTIASVDQIEDLKQNVKNLLPIGLKMMKLRNAGDDSIMKCMPLMRKYKPIAETLETKVINHSKAKLEFQTATTNLKLCLTCLKGSADSHCLQAKKYFN